MRFPRTRTASIVASLLCASSAHAAPGWQYVVDSMQVVDLNVPSTYDSRAYDINNNGDIVGSSTNASGLYGFFFSAANNASYDITGGLVGGVARGINDYGVVVGDFIGDAALTKPFVWYWGIYATEMGANPAAPMPYKWDTSAVAVNNLQNVAGSANRREDPNLPPPPNTGGDCYETLAVRWSSINAQAAMVYCPAYGPEEPEVTATDINNAGSIIGNDGEANNFASRMFLWKQATNQLVAVALPANTAQITYKWGTAEGLSDGHRVVGTAITNTLPRAFIWNGTSANAQDIGTFSGGAWSNAHDLNEEQMVVGEAQAFRKFSLSGTSHSIAYQAAYIWHPHFGLKALPALSSGGLVPRSCNATAINNRKTSGLVQVAGHCLGNDGRLHAVRWDIVVQKRLLDFAISP